MIQSLIIGAMLIAAVAYLGRMVFRQFKGQSHCETGCGKCGVASQEFKGLTANK